MSVLRWIAVLPGALAASCLAGLLVWLGNYIFLFSSFMAFWVYLIQAAMMGGAFVIAGLRIAPSPSRVLAVVLACIYAAAHVYAVIWVSGSGRYGFVAPTWYVWLTIVVGAGFAFVVAVDWESFCD